MTGAVTVLCPDVNLKDYAMFASRGEDSFCAVTGVS